MNRNNPQCRLFELSTLYVKKLKWAIKNWQQVTFWMNYTKQVESQPRESSFFHRVAYRAEPDGCISSVRTGGAPATVLRWGRLWGHRQRKTLEVTRRWSCMSFYFIFLSLRFLSFLCFSEDRMEASIASEVHKLILSRYRAGFGAFSGTRVLGCSLTPGQAWRLTLSVVESSLTEWCPKRLASLPSSLSMIGIRVLVRRE